MAGETPEAKVTLRASSKAKPQRLRAVDHQNLLILIGGTTDPVNMADVHSQGHSDPGVSSKTDYWGMTLEKLAQENLQDLDWYWQKDQEFRAKLVSLQKEYLGLAIFAAHGWSGDNCIANRRVAGAYLANRLCGGEGEKPFYPGWRNKRVDIHLMAHSHGGNVLNEFLRQTAKLEKTWPARWRIHSVTYLSTPFFPNLHPLSTAAFAPECRIINVVNDFDLTQRVIADFNMLQLGKVLETVRVTDVLVKYNEIEFNPRIVVDAVLSARPDVSFAWNMGLGVDFAMAPEKGAALYDHFLDIMRKLDAVFAEVIRVIDDLAKPVKYPVAAGLKGKVKTERPILSAGSAERAKRFVRVCKEAVRPLQERLQARRNAGVYTLKGLFDDFTDGNLLLSLVDSVIGFLELDTVRLTGPVPDLFVSVALDQLEQFDDTVRTPAKHLAGTSFENRVVQVDVTAADHYEFIPSCAPYRARYPDLIARLERLEAAYANSRDKRDLTDLLFTLAAQHEVVRTVVSRWSGYELVSSVKQYESGQWLASHAPEYETALAYTSGLLGALAWIDEQLTWIGERTHILDTLARLAKAVHRWYSVLHSRDVGGIAVPKEVAASADPTDPSIGSVEWLSYVSHSVSRRTLHPKVEQALRGQITSLKAARK